MARATDHRSDDRPRFYGRRFGHSLSPRQRARLDAVLARCGVPVADTPLDPASLFPDRRPVWLEIGFGGGEHLAAQAAANPSVGLIGCEPYVNGVSTLVRLIEEQNLENIRIFPEDARLLLPRLAPASIARVFLLFPDPWPKARHHRRRFVQPENLDLVARALADGGEFRFASDHAEYGRWALQKIRAHGAFAWTARRPGDWRDRPADWPPTRFEEKGRAAGRPPLFLRFVRRPRGGAEGA